MLEHISNSSPSGIVLTKGGEQDGRIWERFTIYLTVVNNTVAAPSAQRNEIVKNDAMTLFFEFMIRDILAYRPVVRSKKVNLVSLWQSHL